MGQPSCRCPTRRSASRMRDPDRRRAHRPRGSGEPTHGTMIDGARLLPGARTARHQRRPHHPHPKKRRSRPVARLISFRPNGAATEETSLRALIPGDGEAVAVVAHANASPAGRTNCRYRPEDTRGRRGPLRSSFAGDYSRRSSLVAAQLNFDTVGQRAWASCSCFSGTLAWSPRRARPWR